MDIRTLNDTISVAPQIEASDVAAIKAAGFRTIICNRPDGEAPGQPTFDAIAAAASAEGLEVRHIPIVGVTEPDIAAFGAALTEMPGPVLAYCRSGTRSATLWSLSQAGTLPADEILSATRAAGYDMSGLAPRLTVG